LPAEVDEVVEGVAADDGAAGPGLVEDAHQDEVVLPAVVLGDAALLVDGAFLSSPPESRK
jgi:hypothetical protein